MAAGRKGSEQPQRDPREQALKLLRTVKPPLDLDGDSSRDPVWLAERICDSFPQFDGMKAMHTLFLLLMETFDRLSLEFIHREYFLLDPGALAEDAMARWFEDLQYEEGPVVHFTCEDASCSISHQSRGAHTFESTVGQPAAFGLRNGNSATPLRSLMIGTEIPQFFYLKRIVTI